MVSDNFWYRIAATTGSLHHNEMKKKKQTAIYLRISMEDMNGGESNSISNQRSLLKDYIAQNADLAGSEILEFCDDGFSGTNMDRPGMQEMLKQIKEKRIGCILVKDLSRFSRDYIELGTYLNQIFPFMGIRFIAVNDNYDSREQEGTAIAMDTAFKTLLYDLYSKDVSVKVKSSLENKYAQGEYAFGQVPFGYEKSKEVKNAVIVNEKEGEIVRRIFALAITGKSCMEIARILQEEGIPTAIQMRYPDRKQKENLAWGHQMVRRILSSRFYLGEMAYGKSIRKSVGSKKGIAVPESEWKVLPNHHEPLVCEEIFQKVNSGQPGGTAKRKREKHPLVGVIYCGGCGYSMSYKPAKSRRFECRKHSILQIESCCTYFNADFLEEIILTRLCRELLLRGNAMKEGRSMEAYRKSVMENMRSRRKEYRIKCDSMQRERDTLYERYFEKQITAKEYRIKSDGLTEKINSLIEQLVALQRKYQRIEEEHDRYNKDMKQVVRFAHMEELTQEAVDIFIKRIYTYKDKRVEIEWNFAEGSNVIQNDKSE